MKNMPMNSKPPPAALKAHVESGLESQLVLGALVALLTIATAYVAYRSTAASLDSSTLDFYATKQMQRASLLHLRGNAAYMIDVAAHDRYSELQDQAPDRAQEILNQASPELLAGLERPGGPFDAAYDSARYGEAEAAFEEAQALYDQADEASVEAEQFALGSAILSIGLGATAWAALLQRHSLLRLVFAVLAIASLLAALALVFLWSGP